MPTLVWTVLGLSTKNAEPWQCRYKKRRELQRLYFQSMCLPLIDGAPAPGARKLCKTYGQSRAKAGPKPTKLHRPPAAFADQEPARHAFCLQLQKHLAFDCNILRLMQFDAIWCNLMQFDAIWCNLQFKSFCRLSWGCCAPPGNPFGLAYMVPWRNRHGAKAKARNTANERNKTTGTAAWYGMSPYCCMA